MSEAQSVGNQGHSAQPWFESISGRLRPRPGPTLSEAPGDGADGFEVFEKGTVRFFLAILGWLRHNMDK
jgi:hypothetical protein